MLKLDQEEKGISQGTVKQGTTNSSGQASQDILGLAYEIWESQDEVSSKTLNLGFIC